MPRLDCLAAMEALAKIAGGEQDKALELRNTLIGLGKLKVESGKWKVFCANVFSILGSWREFKCGEESSVLPETFMRGIAQALGGAWWLLRHFLKNFFAVLRFRSAASFDAVRYLA